MEVFSDLRIVVRQFVGELEAWDLKMQEYLNQDLTIFPYNKSLEAEIRMLIPLPLLQPPWHRVYLGLSWSRIYVSLPR